MEEAQAKKGDVLLALLAQKQVEAESLRSITIAMPMLLEQENTEQMLENLSLRQTAMDSIDALDAQIALLFDALQPMQDQLSSQYQAAVAIIRGIFAEIHSIDEQLRCDTKRQLLLYQADIKQAGLTRQGVNAYTNLAGQQGSLYFDCKN